jgi:anti-anti-sigma factor
VTGELDLAAVDQFTNDLSRLINGSGQMILDVAGLDFMDSSGLSAIVLEHTGSIPTL